MEAWMDILKFKVNFMFYKDIFCEDVQCNFQFLKKDI